MMNIPDDIYWPWVKHFDPYDYNNFPIENKLDLIRIITIVEYINENNYDYRKYLDV